MAAKKSKDPRTVAGEAFDFAKAEFKKHFDALNIVLQRKRALKSELRAAARGEDFKKVAKLQGQLEEAEGEEPALTELVNQLTKAYDHAASALIKANFAREDLQDTVTVIRATVVNPMTLSKDSCVYVAGQYDTVQLTVDEHSFDNEPTRLENWVRNNGLAMDLQKQEIVI